MALDLAKRAMPNPRIGEPNRMNTGAVPGLGDVEGTTGDLGWHLATTAMPNLVMVVTETEAVPNLLNTGVASSRIDLVDMEGTAGTGKDETGRPNGAVPSLDEGGNTKYQPRVSHGNGEHQTILSGVEKVPSTDGHTGNGSDRTLPNP